MLMEKLPKAVNTTCLVVQSLTGWYLFIHGTANSYRNGSRADTQRFRQIFCMEDTGHGTILC